jgi:hypothetical protein
VKQPDSDTLRVWEVAGAAHGDTYLLLASHADDGTLSPGQLADLLRPVRDVYGIATARPINGGPPQHFVTHAAYEHLVRSVDSGVAAPMAARLEIDETGDDFNRDGDGVAVGGVRTPWVSTPSAVFSGLGQTGDAFTLLFGTTAELDEQSVAARYPAGRDDYLEQFAAALDETIAAGFLLTDDRPEILSIASSAPLEMSR